MIMMLMMLMMMMMMMIKPLFVFHPPVFALCFVFSLLTFYSSPRIYVRDRTSNYGD